ncbi:unnamed protein product, partial [Ixodes pacificus]
LQIGQVSVPYQKRSAAWAGVCELSLLINHGPPAGAQYPSPQSPRAGRGGCRFVVHRNASPDFKGPVSRLRRETCGGASCRQRGIEPPSWPVDLITCELRFLL